jgi:hypothetical protein
MNNRHIWPLHWVLHQVRSYCDPSRFYSEFDDEKLRPDCSLMMACIINSDSLTVVPHILTGSGSHTECKKVIEKLYQIFRTHDATLIEVNPLVETKEGTVMVR